jgi:hypothetical protein
VAEVPHDLPYFVLIVRADVPVLRESDSSFLGNDPAEVTNHEIHELTQRMSLKVGVFSTWLHHEL